MSQNNNFDFEINRQTLTILIVGLAVAIVILPVLAYGIITYTSQPAPAPTEIAPTEPWPTPKASVTPTATNAPKATITPQPSATPIIVSWRELGHLTSVEYTLKTVVALERPQKDNFFCATLGICGNDKVILSAVGNVKAGIDMTAIDEGDVEIDGSSVKIALPPATITGVELVPAETVIFDSRQQWILSDYEGLEIEALDTARNQLYDWALNRVLILDTAESLAQSQLETFLGQLGFEKIEITFKEK